jgi:predicted ATPase with chaperone activity
VADQAIRDGATCPAPLVAPQVERNLGRISGPPMDHIDLDFEVPAPSLRELRGESGERSAVVAERVATARDRQGARFPRRPLLFKAAMDAAGVRHCWALDPPASGCSTPPSSGWACRLPRWLACSS